MRDLTLACIQAGYTLILAWRLFLMGGKFKGKKKGSCEEAARILEAYKVQEFKPPTTIKSSLTSSTYSINQHSPSSSLTPTQETLNTVNTPSLLTSSGWE